MTEAAEQLGVGAILDAVFIKEMTKQLVALDSYGSYDGWSTDRILAPMVLNKQQRREIPVIGDPDEVTIARVKGYYNALASVIEHRGGKMASCLVNLSHEGFGRALIMIGKLVVVDRSLRDVHRFGFDSLEALNAEGEKIVASALKVLESYPQAAEA